MANVCFMVHLVCLFMKTHLLALLQGNCLDLLCCAFLSKLSGCVRNMTAFCQHLLRPIYRPFWPIAIYRQNPNIGWYIGLSLMVMYTISTWPLMQALNNELYIMMWNRYICDTRFTDDSSAVRLLKGVTKWWEYLQAKGSDFGYCPKPAKTILIVKGSRLKKSAQEIFKDPKIKITDQGEHNLGSVIGT